MVTAPELTGAAPGSSPGHRGGGQWRKGIINVPSPPGCRGSGLISQMGKVGLKEPPIGSTGQGQDLSVHSGLDASFQTIPSTFHRLRPSSLEENLLNISSPFLSSTYLLLISRHLWGTVLPRQGLCSKRWWQGELGRSRDPFSVPESLARLARASTLLSPSSSPWQLQLPKCAPFFSIPTGYQSARVGLGLGWGWGDRELGERVKIVNE